MALNTGTAVGYSYRNITAASPTTTVVKTGAGILHTVALSTPVATGTIVIYDNTAATGTKIASYTTAASPSPTTVTYDAAFSTGLTIVTDVAAQDITITFI